MMKLLMLVFLFVIFAVHQTFAVKITSNELQRVTKGEECTFRWTVDEPITSYVIYNRTTGSPVTLRQNSYQDYDNSSGVITLVLINVQLTDAGNYSLEIAKGSNTVIDSTACLFVYGPLEGNLVLTFGSNPATEGYAVELTCNLTSTSMPVTNRPKIQYTWEIPGRNRFAGPLTLWNGDEVMGYAVKNDGRTLRIGSIRYPDDDDVMCHGLEEGSNPKMLPINRDVCRDDQNSLRDQLISKQCAEEFFYRCYTIHLRFHLSIRHRPYISALNPESKKFNAVIGKPVELSFYISPDSSVTSTTNWTFVNSAGILQELPSHSYAPSYDYRRWIRFNFTSMEYYGNYSITVTNEIGSTNISFEVVPEGPPDAPSNVRLKYASHCEIAIQWNFMHSNSYERSERVFKPVLLKLSEYGSTAETSGVTYLAETLESAQSYHFTKNIQPQTNYKVSVWSVNEFGSSEVVEFQVRTRKQPKLQVSPETISIEGTRAIIDFTIELGDEDVEEVVRVEAKCCSVFSGKCSNYFGRYNGNQVVVYNIPDGTVCFIDLTIYSGNFDKYNYYSNSVRGIRVSRSRNEDRTPDSHLTAVPILAFLDQQCSGISDFTEETPPQD